ncbi:hypothetical protein FLONG3_2571 [Fusarium longipes]|uniref:Uncharacterized protein n=1 Tax=Fusarium longipes TaxID=694270 RepID=A0A395T4U1_9HYPO|nr:hypothetical protein FLONG3_2571 [Fusarium longipes]
MLVAASANISMDARCVASDRRSELSETIHLLDLLLSLTALPSSDSSHEMEANEIIKDDPSVIYGTTFKKVTSFGLKWTEFDDLHHALRPGAEITDDERFYLWVETFRE